MINLSGVRASLCDPMVAVVIIACCALSASAIGAQQAGDIANFIGSWVGCDGQTVNFAYGGDEHTGQFVGNYTKLGSLGRFHFEANEVGYGAEQRSANEYTGQVKWRSVDGNVFGSPTKSRSAATIILTTDRILAAELCGGSPIEKPCH